MPTLILKNTFVFYEKAIVPKEYEGWLTNDIAINIIIKILKIKLSKSGKENRLYFLKGRTGSGKSTVLRCINGLEKPESGKIYVNGELFDEKNKENHSDGVFNGRGIDVIGMLGEPGNKLYIFTHQ